MKMVVGYRLTIDSYLRQTRSDMYDLLLERRVGKRGAPPQEAVPGTPQIGGPVCRYLTLIFERSVSGAAISVYSYLETELHSS